MAEPETIETCVTSQQRGYRSGAQELQVGTGISWLRTPLVEGELVMPPCPGNLNSSAR